MTDKIEQGIHNYKLAYQYLIITFFAALFCVCAIIGKAENMQKISFWVWGIVSIFILCFLWICYCCKRSKKGTEIWNCKRFDFFELALVIICVLSRLPMFGTIQRWDAAIYYSNIYEAVKQFDFSLAEIVENFRLAGHLSYMYTFFASMGEFLFPGKEIGVHLVNMALTSAAMICIYRMFRFYWCRMPKWLAMWSTVIVSLLPIYWGTFTQINIDYPLLLFFVFLLYAEYKQQKVLMAFWTVAIILTKESGCFILAGYYVAYLLALWKHKEKEKFSKKIKRVLNDGLIRAMIVGGIAGIILIIYRGGISLWGTNKSFFATKAVIGSYSMSVAGFYFYPPYILHKCLQIFALNFMWIFSGIIFWACLRRRRARMQGKTVEGINGLPSMLGALIGFILFSCFYLIHAISRYLIFSAGILAIIAMIYFYIEFYDELNKKKHTVILAGITVLLIIQNFVYIDPISNLIFDRYETGKGKILSVNINIPRADTYVNNFRFSYIDLLLDKMLEEVGYHSGMEIVKFDRMQEQNFIDGLYDYVLGWDTDQKKRIFMCDENKKNNDDLILVNTVMYDEIVEGGTEELSDELLVFFLPIYDIDVQETLNTFEGEYDIMENKQISNWGGTLEYYILMRRK